jgi:acyl-CoA synthetase (AMP-forming)/AMP-acid ligase II
MAIGHQSATTLAPDRRLELAGWSEAIALGDLLLRAAARDPGREAIVTPVQRLTYGELATAARVIARGLIGLGIERGDRVGVLMANGWQTAACLYGVVLSGASVVPMNIRYRAVELPHVIRDSGQKVIRTDDRIDDHVDLGRLLEEALPGIASGDPCALRPDAAPELSTIVSFGARQKPGMLDARGFEQLAAAVPEHVVDERRAGVRVRDEAVLLYTSGTTDLPRGCPLTHEALGRSWTVVGRVLRVGPDDRLWAPCPMFHLATVGPLILCAAHGASLLTDTWCEPARALELIEHERATVLYPAYPPITQALIDQPGFPTADMSAARAMLNVAPPA